MRKGKRSQGGIVVWPTGNGPLIKRTKITTELDWSPAIRCQPPTQWVADDDRAITVRDVTITGSAAKGSAIELRDRPGSVFEGTKIEQTGGERDGIQMIRSNPCTFAWSSVRASRYPIFVISPQTNQCLVTVKGNTELERSMPDPEAVRATKLPSLDPAKVPGFLLPGVPDGRCIGTSMLSGVKTPKGIGITRVLGDTVYWIPRSSIETATSR
jgi:hypothetical protein